jgi:endoglucanase
MSTDILTNYSQAPNPLQNVPNSRLDKLAKGINVSKWFSNSYSANRYDRYLSNKNLQFIHDVGFKHIRLPINPTLLFQEDNSGVLNPTVLPFIDRAIARIQAKDLAVIIDIHPRGKAGNTFQKRLLYDPTFADKYVQFWGAFAKHLSSTNPDYVFLETLNEPYCFAGEDISHIDSNSVLQWEHLQPRILEAMRQNAPQHTLIAKAIGDGYKTLLTSKPVSDKNVVYDFHFYSPFKFTHQGASWLPSDIASLKGFSYNSNSQASDSASQQAKSDNSDPLTNPQGNRTWNANKIDWIFHQIGDWAAANHVPVIADEFGALRNNAPREDRINWFRDVSNSLDRYGIGKSLWSYEDPFGLTYIEDKRKVFDQDVAKAIGLKFNPLNIPATLFSPNPP